MTARQSPRPKRTRRKTADPHLWWLEPGAPSPYMPAYMAFQEAPPAQQRRKALEKILPALEHREQCENQIVFALKCIEFGKRFETVPSSLAADKQRFRKHAKTLRQASEIMAKLSSNSVDQAKSTADAYDQVADAIPVRKGSPLQSEAKKIAVYMAFRLLTNFAGGAPGMTRDGAWHELSEILYGEGVDFGYLRHQHKRNIGPRLFPS